MGKPRLSADTTARVKINVGDENDSPPEFSESVYSEVLLLPTFKNVSVFQAVASDPDVGLVSNLKYSITSGNLDQVFGIEELTGRLFVQKPELVELNPRYALDLAVSDGKFTAQARLNLNVQRSENSGLAFSKG